MAVIPQTTFENIPQYPKSWYWGSGNWAAQTTAGNRTKLTSPTAIQVDVEGYSLTNLVAQELDISSATVWDTIEGTDYSAAAARAGKDFYVYACIGTSVVPVIVISANATYPSGYTASNSRKIGGFHCLCASMETPATRANVAYALGATVIPASPNGFRYTCQVAGTSVGEPAWPTTDGATVTDGATLVWRCELHPAEGYVTGDIIPNSVWDLRRRSRSGSNVGMAYVAELDDWYGIYLTSGTLAAPAVVYGGTILDTQDWNNCYDAARRLGGRFPRDAEFQIAADMSNQSTNITGSADPVTTGGHVDTNGRRMLSKYFLEDCCGAMYQWLDEGSWRFDAATVHYHKYTSITGDAGTFTSGNAVAEDGTTAQDIAPGWAWTTAITGNRGQLYKQGTYGDVKLLAGGSWSSGGPCGSRSRNLYCRRWYVVSYVGFRLVARNLNK